MEMGGSALCPVHGSNCYLTKKRTYPCSIAIRKYKQMYNLKRDLNRIEWKNVLPNREIFYFTIRLGARCNVCLDKLKNCRICKDVHCCNNLYTNK
jgi:hypothetical protein